ncbi:uncharacterized protein TNCV_2610521 [Trichonephila clavipes]|nr:uncharacterized protein TNCV_2610521 [Trichonephila clavipes]
MHARHGLADMFENNWYLMDRHSGDVHSCHQVNFRNDERTVNRNSERYMFELELIIHKNYEWLSFWQTEAKVKIKTQNQWKRVIILLKEQNQLRYMVCQLTKSLAGKCPEGNHHGVSIKRAIAKGETPGSHSSMRTYLSPQVVEKIMPVYQRLASGTILERCVASKTQNSNESLHSGASFARKCPKRYSSPKKAGNSSNECH